MFLGKFDLTIHTQSEGTSYNLLGAEVCCLHPVVGVDVRNTTAIWDQMYGSITLEPFNESIAGEGDFSFFADGYDANFYVSVSRRLLPFHSFFY